MINIVDKRDCCGCNACTQVCPVKCIDFVVDNEGFSYPHVDKDRCINCGLCEKVCPFINVGDDKLPISTYAAKNTDEERRRQSSSGGIFIELAAHVINLGGIVFGVKFDSEWNAVFDYADSTEDLRPFMSSKYVQAHVGESFKQAKKFLNDGRTVLFSGTPCQIKGLKLYLRKYYETLITVDVSCHGVPSPGVWQDYLKNVTHGNISKIGDVQFRSKEGFDWNNYGFVIKARGNEQHYIERINATSDLYVKAFLTNLTLRPSCYTCRCKGGKSQSDITLADFWGIEMVDPTMDDTKGVSLILANTMKGEKLLQSLNLCLAKEDYDEAYPYNLGLHPHTQYNIERKSFFRRYAKRANIVGLLRKYTSSDIVSKIRRRLKRLLNKIIQL